MKKLLCLFFLIAIGSLSAKDRKEVHHLNGRIVDESSTPIENVGVYNKTTGSYSYSDISGGFKLEISVDDIVNFHILGFETKEIIITDKELDQDIEIVLKEAAVSLDQVVLVSKINALSKIVDVDIKTNPVKSSQEILRKVPGLIIGQHAGGGKAEQIFLRGFDVDHGTDVAINVDGLPVNLPSHAHGQGYADLHFLIPETIENVDFGKGLYYADKGNFNTAGYVDLNIKDRIDKSLISVEVGQFNSLRAVGLLKVAEGEFSSAYIASEISLTDGVFDASQNFNRINLLGRYNYNNRKDEELTLSISHFQSRWDASGQIPQRAVDQGIIGRFGAIDSTEGGITSRSNIWLKHFKQLNENSSVKTKAFLSVYDFELYSNFTFFLRNPVDGDQIRQSESRTIIGAETVYSTNFDLQNNNAQLSFQGGIGFRYDDVNDVELSFTRNRRELLERRAFGDVDEVNGYAFASATYKVNNWSFVPGVRLDYFRFGYDNFISGFRPDGPDQPNRFDNRQVDDVIVSPKLNVLYTPSNNLQLYAKAGFGFHSNDSRVVTNPQGLGLANNNDQNLETLPSAFGADLGTIFKPTDRLVINAAIWGLGLEQEFVYVGDEAVVEPSGRSRRYGADFGVRYQITDWLFANADINYTLARSIDEPDGQDFIPLAPDLTSAGGLTVKNLGKFSGGINYRYLDDRPANEDDSIVAEGYFVTDFNLNYNFAKNWNIGLVIENLFDVEWNETQFATETRLFDEAEPVEEITFTPGTPFQARFKLSVNF
ncbi:TonB-dependent receptor [Flavobacteriaceae bacterium R38]|nr:TonB-dependent receptor [Flavobacteriaceae bacterium R38]